jgi:hypothetical protein
VRNQFQLAQYALIGALFVAEVLLYLACSLQLEKTRPEGLARLVGVGLRPFEGLVGLHLLGLYVCVLLCFARIQPCVHSTAQRVSRCEDTVQRGYRMTLQLCMPAAVVAALDFLPSAAYCRATVARFDIVYTGVCFGGATYAIYYCIAAGQCRQRSFSSSVSVACLCLPNIHVGFGYQGLRCCAYV